MRANTTAKAIVKFKPPPPVALKAVVLCKIQPCDRKVVAKGYCNAHYYRVHKGETGDELRRPIEIRARHTSPSAIVRAPRQSKIQEIGRVFFFACQMNGLDPHTELAKWQAGFARKFLVKSLKTLGG